MTTMNALGPAQSTLLDDEADGKIEKKVKDNAKTESTVIAIDVLKKSTKEKPETTDSDEPALGFGGEGYAMLTSMSFDLTENSDKYVQDLLDKITKIVIEANGNLTEKDIDKIKNVGLEDYREVASTVMKRIMQFIRWSITQGKEGIKRIADRLGRLGMKSMYVERKLDISTDSSLPTDQFVLPRSFPLLMLADKPPANAMDVLNSLNKTKYLFNLVHNDYQNYQNLFKQAVATGSRAETLAMINNWLSSLAGRLGAKPNTQFNNKPSFNYIPGGYRLVFSTGDSFADCSAVLVRVPGKYDVAPTAARPDKSSLVRLMAEIKTFLRTINEIYGKVSTRLESDFRNIARTVEKDVKGFDSASDIRTASTTVDWFIEQQNRVFTRTMMLSCSVLNACLDYCLAAIDAKPAAGMEDFDDSASVEAVSEQMDLIDDRLRSIEVDASVIQSIGDNKDLVDCDSDYVIRQLIESSNPEPFSPGYGIDNLRNMHHLVKSGKTTELIIRRLGAIMDMTSDLDEATLFMKTLFTERQLFNCRTTNQYIADFTANHPLCSFLHRAERETLGAAQIANYLEQNADKIHATVTVLTAFAENLADTVVDGEFNVSKLKEFMLNGPESPFTEALLCGGYQIKERSENLAGLIVRSYTLEHVKDLSPIEQFDIHDNEMNSFIDVQIKRFETEYERLAHIVQLLQVGTGHLRYITATVVDNLNVGGLKGEGDNWVYTAMEYLTVATRQYRWMYRLTLQLAMYNRLTIDAGCQYMSGGFYGFEQQQEPV